MAIHFFYQKENFQLDSEKESQNWIEGILNEYGFRSGMIQYIFMSDDELLQINRNYLNHDYYTDIITFPLKNYKQSIDSDIYISIDRIKDNAKEYDVTFKDELDRVMIHGILHLCGFQDKSEEERQKMRGLEEKALNLR